jgi:hypothetical protein
VIWFLAKFNMPFGYGANVAADARWQQCLFRRGGRIQKTFSLPKANPSIDLPVLRN